MTAPLVYARTDRNAPASRSAASAPATDPDADATTNGQAMIAAQHAAFDFDLAERAELMREHEALTTLMMEQLKNEDEIMKKWIALI